MTTRKSRSSHATRPGLGEAFLRITRSLGLTLTAIVLSTAACGRVLDPTGGEPLPPEWSDEQLIAAAHGPDTLPAGFYSEDWGAASPYYVNTVSLRQSEDRWIELSTESVDEARSWARTSDSNSSVHRIFTTERVTPKYFEFLAVNPPPSPHGVRFRAHRSSYLGRSGVDLFRAGAVLGTFRVQPVTAVAVKELAEYLWLLASARSQGVRALGSSGFQTEAWQFRTIYWLVLSRGDLGMPVRISLARTIYRVSRTSGEITETREALRTISGS